MPRNKFLRNETGLFVSAGAQYGVGGKSFLRMNLACPRSRMENGLAWLERGVKLFQSQGNTPTTKSGKNQF